MWCNGIDFNAAGERFRLDKQQAMLHVSALA